MRKLESVLLAWSSVTVFGMFIAVGGMHKLNLWDAQMAIYLVLVSIVAGMFAGVAAGTQEKVEDVNADADAWIANASDEQLDALYEELVGEDFLYKE